MDKDFPLSIFKTTRVSLCVKNKKLNRQIVRLKIRMEDVLFPRL